MIALTDGQEDVLQSPLRAHSASQGDALRARIVLSLGCSKLAERGDRRWIEHRD